MAAGKGTVKITVVPALDREALAAMQRSVASIYAAIDELAVAASRAAAVIERAIHDYADATRTDPPVQE